MKIHSILILLSLSFHPTLGAQDWSQIMKLSGPVIGKVEVISANGALMSTGSGFIINEKGEFLTNAHVVQEARFHPDRQLKVQFTFLKDQPLTTTAKILAYDLSLDLCILELEKYPGGRLSFSQEDEPALMSPIIVAGYPLGQSFKATPGYVQAVHERDLTRNLLDLSAQVDPGNSGGPVLDGKGEVVGVVNARIPGANFNFAITVSTVKAFLNRAERGVISLSVSSTPPGAWLFLNGDYLGVTPLAIETSNLTSEIRLEKQGFKPLVLAQGPWSENDTQLDFKLEAEANLEKTITISTTPEGARVWINNQDEGVSPVVLTAEEGRILRIRIQKSGFQDRSLEYIVKPETEQRVQIPLK